MKRHPREIMPIEPYPRVTEPPKCKICGREMYQRRFDGRYICPLHGTFEKQTKIEMERGRRLMEKQSKLEEIREWAENHKTVILLNGGYSEHIRELIHFFHSAENQYPWTVFNESLDALDGAVTCAGIVLPEKIYEGAALLRSDRDGFILNTLKATDTITLENGVEGYNGWEQELMQRLNTFRLAN